MVFSPARHMEDRGARPSQIDRNGQDFFSVNYCGGRRGNSLALSMGAIKKIPLRQFLASRGCLSFKRHRVFVAALHPLLNAQILV